MTQVKEAGTEILRVLCGSRAYGLHDDNSDWDYHSIFVTPTSELLKVGYKPKDTVWKEGQKEDVQSWEVGHFLNLALHGNPTILETFVAPVETYSKWGYKIRELFPYVISRKRIYESFKGYAANQRKKMFEPTGGVLAGERMWKFAVAYLRVLYHGVLLLGNGFYDPYIREVRMRSLLKEIKLGNIDKGNIINEAERLQENLIDTYLQSSIQDEPNMTVINDTLLALRKDMW